MSTDPIADRRRRSKDAYHDKISEIRATTVTGFPAVEEAVEVATQVKITKEMLAAMDPAVGDRETRLRAAFYAAGFEVIE